MIIRLLVLLLLPLILLLIWRRFTRGEGETAGALDYGLLGLSLVILAGLGVMALTQDFGRPGDVYEPARVIDGQVVPGTSRPADGEGGEAAPAADEGAERQAAD
ncbi:hypothetical protein C882_2238 [Caenispirillum salinarum AK4]|uniref:Uncharacterized protein n=1 Tax=Caenispirillum salinarum AK4 TaxID=1238182 RepID=K9HD21_9PROT|nr:hypothetical protein [Caenispirillum salinarum]EKV26611.1 hypothetical protein C882_2238 [Caenispirillum salinarum AK4]